MTRRGGASKLNQNAIPNGRSLAVGDNLPPPSTIAAQIVHNRSHVARQEPENKALFGELLQEYLKNPVIEEANVETNAQLIGVVAEAGLDVLLKDDPFAPDTLLQQATDSLLVIQLTIKRTPDVLLYGSNDESPNGEKPPLLLWLLPKILSLLGGNHMNAVQDALCTFLHLCIEILYSHSKLRNYACTLITIFQEIVDGILTTLESRVSDVVPIYPPLNLALPPPESIYRFWPSARLAVVLPQNYQVHIRDTAQAHLIALALISPIRCTSWSNKHELRRPLVSASQAWLIDCCRRTLKSCRSSTDVTAQNRNLILGAIITVASRDYMPSCPKSKPTALVDLIVQTLSLCKGCTACTELKTPLEDCFRKLIEGSKAYPRTLAECNRRLLPCIIELLGDERCLPDCEEVKAVLNDAQQQLEALSRPTVDEDRARPSKRMRLIDDGTPDLQNKEYHARIEQITDVLCGQPKSYLSGLQDTALDRYTVLSAQDQQALLTSIGQLPCVVVRCIGRTTARCRICDLYSIDKSGTAPASWDATVSREEYSEVVGFLATLVEDSDVRRSREPRILAAQAMRRVINHLHDSDFLSLGTSQFGPWLMRSLQSSVRELRIAAAQALMAYLRDDLPSEIRSKNRREALDFFKCLTERNSLSEQETLVMTWGLVGRTCGDAELNIALIQLVDYLGHTHSLICGVAYHEILRLAEHLNRSPLELFKPFWSSVAMLVVKDLITCPQKAQQLADLLSMSVNELLMLTQTDTLPYLILMRKRDVLQRLAQARSAHTNVQDMWLQPSKNLAAVMSLLLVQQSPDVEQASYDLLQDAAPGFMDETDLSALVKVDPILIACEILKHAGDLPEGKKTNAHQALRLLAVLTERKSGQSKAPKSSKMLSSFLESHVLGIMSHFTDIIDSSLERQSIAEKKRSLRAIEQLIGFARSHVGVAMPQIRATLQSAFQDPNLVDDAFSAWAALVAASGEEEVESIVDHTFSIIVQNWASFSAQSQHRAHDTIAAMLKAHNALIRDRIEMIPSLAGIELLQKFEGEINRFKVALDPMARFEAFSRRCKDESATIVQQALVELVPFLSTHQKLLHESAVSEQPSPHIAGISRAIMDASVRFKETQSDILDLCAQCLGILGSIDPNRIESVRDKREILMLSNFEKASEVIDFVATMLETVLVEAFHSAPTGKTQTYLAYVLQELLKFCGFRMAVMYRPKSSQASPTYQRWIQIPEAVRSTLTPYFNSKYVIVHPAMPAGGNDFPLFEHGMTHGTWLRTFVFNLLHSGKGENAGMVFPVLSRVIWGHDLAIPTFLLPFVVLNIIVGGTDPEVENIRKEFLEVLSFDIMDLSESEAENVKQCSENVFQVLDYLSRWLQAKKKTLHEALSGNQRANQIPAEFDEIQETSHISSVEGVLAAIPADVISRRAVQCRSFSRALFHWEQHIRQTVERAGSQREVANMEDQFKHLQQIYAQIDELDGIEGISTKLQILDPEQQVLEHKRAGRWTAAQSWYELSLAESPNDQSLQLELLTCLKSAGHYGPLLDYVQNLAGTLIELPSQTIAFAAEASWTTGKWHMLEQFLTTDHASKSQDFNIGVGKALLALRCQDQTSFQQTISTLRSDVTRGLSLSATASLAAAHPHTIKLHALYELEMISGLSNPKAEPEVLMETLDRRLDVLGAFTDSKQYLLGLRRAAMGLSKLDFTKQQIASSWLLSARLHRKSGLVDAAYDAVLHATHLHDGAARLEHSRLLWRDGHHRKAIQNLQGAVEADVFQSFNKTTNTTGSLVKPTGIPGGNTAAQNTPQNPVLAKSQLLLAKWMDSAGQTKSEDIRDYYHQALKSHNRWEKAHYYMGKYYLKVLDAEKAAPKGKQTESFLTADCQKLVIENFMRSMVFGAKYYHQTVPKMLTLWLDLGAELHNAERNAKNLDQHHAAKAKKLETIHKQVKKYFDRLPSYIFYTALPQIMSRINHPHPKVSELLTNMISKITSSYPQQSLWSLLAVSKAKAQDKSSKAMLVLSQLKRVKANESPLEMKTLILHGQRLSEALLYACEVPVDQRASHASLQRDLGFSHKLAPSHLVVPVEKTLTAALPLGSGGQAIRGHRPFPRNPITISSFQDDVLVLSSLQRPRKLTIRGSDGEQYGLLCKPKDDLRKDQRLMEFTGMIDRALKKDVESSKRRMYIRTYAVTPLNEECGAIEWVDGLKPMRDIILANYKSKGVRPDYGELRQLLDKACADPDHGSSKIFTDQVITKFRPTLHEWFVETFPEPDSWFTARLRYTRSCAVMSIVGHVLGLGDRHGENILLEEGNGGCFHVDFNCLFDKGLTFEKPELVPFRLTHNMVDAFGAYGYEGPFRMAAELTLKILRQYEDTLMTIMETFLYDPTTDFIGKPKKKVQYVPETPTEVLDSVRGKVRGMLAGETVPLSVDGYVDALISMAVDPGRLAGMYIGWCAFF
ncbi:hypothetical protein EJ08DRAFT_649062 [Tothia fuscella]|uniref:non-specific serine/threonine protein kinase n=1 Tax=Tothia fuscella TaxID=1048955 RepID=A0A9P4TZ12_9PEZI|nr:hypothetical protein EJ08DRAFT_649062 [Tothia fuscella]